MEHDMKIVISSQVGVSQARKTSLALFFFLSG